MSPLIFASCRDCLSYLASAETVRASCRGYRRRKMASGRDCPCDSASCRDLGRKLNHTDNLGRKLFTKHNSLGRKLFTKHNSLGRKQEIADSLGGSQNMTDSLCRKRKLADSFIPCDEECHSSQGQIVLTTKSPDFKIRSGFII